MVFTINDFIEFCDNMAIAVEAKKYPVQGLLKDKQTLSKYRQSVDSLLVDIRTNKNNCMNHAVGKHADYTSASRYFGEGDFVSYFLPNVDISKYTHKAIKASKDDIANKIYYNDRHILVTYEYDNTIGKIHDNHNPNEDDKETCKILIVIRNTGFDENHIPSLELVTVYPVDETKYLVINDYA